MASAVVIVLKYVNIMVVVRKDICFINHLIQGWMASKPHLTIFLMFPFKKLLIINVITRYIRICKWLKCNI